MELKEKVAYIKGLMEGLEYDVSDVYKRQGIGGGIGGGTGCVLEGGGVTINGGRITAYGSYHGAGTVSYTHLDVYKRQR